MSRKVTRREAIKKTSVGVGAIAASAMLANESEARGRKASRLVTVVLDSGCFLTNEEATGFLYSEVGQFKPHFVIHGDGEEILEIPPESIGMDGRIVQVRHTDAKGREKPAGIRLASSLVKYLLRYHELHGRIVTVNLDTFHAILHFNTGQFCSSMRKMRAFKECDGATNVLTGNRKTLGPLAHNINVLYELAPGEALSFTSEGQVIWSTANHPEIAKRFDVEIINDNSTAEMYYRDGMQLDGDNYWLPNQGEPTPVWTHGGGG